MAGEQSKFHGLRQRSDGAKQPQGERSGKTRIAKNGRRMGRPPGKRSNPDYTQISFHLKKEGYYAAQSQLNRAKAEGYFEGDLSDVVDSLLEFYAAYGEPWELMEDSERG